MKPETSSPAGEPATLVPPAVTLAAGEFAVPLPACLPGAA